MERVFILNEDFVTLYDVYRCPNCKHMNDSKPETQFERLISIAGNFHRYFRCPKCLRAFHELEFVQGPSHDYEAGTE